MHVLLFAHLKTLVGRAEFDLTMGEDGSLEGFWNRLLATYPALGAQRAGVRVARNGEFATAATRFANSDEVALIPPVSGG